MANPSQTRGETELATWASQPPPGPLRAKGSPGQQERRRARTRTVRLLNGSPGFESRGGGGCVTYSVLSRLIPWRHQDLSQGVMGLTETFTHLLPSRASSPHLPTSHSKDPPREHGFLCFCPQSLSPTAPLREAARGLWPTGFTGRQAVGWQFCLQGPGRAPFPCTGVTPRGKRAARAPGSPLETRPGWWERSP